MTPRDLPSITIGDEAFLVQDTVRFQRAVDPVARTGAITALSEGALQIEPDDAPGTRLWVRPGQDGEIVEPVHGPSVVAVVTRREDGAAGLRRTPLQRKTPLQRRAPLRPQRRPLGALPGIEVDGVFTRPARASLPDLRIVTLEGDLRPVPKPQPPHRSPAFLAEVRRLSCCGCGAAPRSQPHHQGRRGVSQKCDDERTAPLCDECHKGVTLTGCLPGRTRPETHLYLLEVQVTLNVWWSRRLEEELQGIVAVPLGFGGIKEAA